MPWLLSSTLSRRECSKVLFCWNDHAGGFLRLRYIFIKGPDQKYDINKAAEQLRNLKHILATCRGAEAYAEGLKIRFSRWARPHKLRITVSLKFCEECLYQFPRVWLQSAQKRDFKTVIRSLWNIEMYGSLSGHCVAVFQDFYGLRWCVPYKWLCSVAITGL